MAELRARPRQLEQERAAQAVPDDTNDGANRFAHLGSYYDRAKHRAKPAPRLPLFLAALVLFGVLAVGLALTSPRNAAQRATDANQSAGAAAGSGEAIKTLWAEFGRAVQPCDDVSSNASDAVGNLQQGTTSRDDVYSSVARAADACGDAWAAIGSLQVPANLDDASRDKVSKTLQTCRDAYSAKNLALKRLATVLDGDFRPSAVDNYTSEQRESEVGIMTCAAGFVEVAQALGVDLSAASGATVGNGHAATNAALSPLLMADAGSPRSPTFQADMIQLWMSVELGLEACDRGHGGIPLAKGGTEQELLVVCANAMRSVLFASIPSSGNHAADIALSEAIAHCITAFGAGQKVTGLTLKKPTAAELVKDRAAERTDGRACRDGFISAAKQSALNLDWK